MKSIFAYFIGKSMEPQNRTLKSIRCLLVFVLSVLVIACDKQTAPVIPAVTENSFASTNTVPNHECTDIYGNQKKLKKALTYKIKPGTVICMAPGAYKDLLLTYGGLGTANKPIVLKAQVPGTVVMSGTSRVRMLGSYVTLQGIIFKDGTSGPSAFILLRAGDRVCNHCRITENTIINWDQDNDEKNNWISIYGQYNRVDHNWVSGKKNRGSMVYVDRRAADPNYVSIDHNYFGDRPPYGGKAYPSVKDGDLEVIRLGSSRHHETGSYSRIEHNLFENIRAETEIVSIKSSHNVIHANTFRASYGSLSNRHGSNNVYSNNFILGDGYPFAGGIRITDSGHTIVNNYIEGVTYPGSVHHGAIVLMAADDPSKYEPGFTGYKQVENVTIAHNTIINSVSSLLLSGGTKKIAPRNITIVNNVVSKAVGPVITHVDKGVPKNSFILNNYVAGSELTDSSDRKEIKGFIYGDPMLEKKSGIARPMPDSVVLGGGIDLSSIEAGKDIEVLRFDIDGQPRAKSIDAGADQVFKDMEPVLFPLTKDKVGPINYSSVAL